jgi:hypothetical protein
MLSWFPAGSFGKDAVAIGVSEWAEHEGLCRAEYGLVITGVR